MWHEPFGNTTIAVFRLIGAMLIIVAIILLVHQNDDPSSKGRYDLHSRTKFAVNIGISGIAIMLGTNSAQRQTK